MIVEVFKGIFTIRLWFRAGREGLVLKNFVDTDFAGIWITENPHLNLLCVALVLAGNPNSSIL